MLQVHVRGKAHNLLLFGCVALIKFKRFSQTLRLPNSLSHCALKTVLSRSSIGGAIRTLYFNKEARLYGFDCASFFQDCASLLPNARSIVGLPTEAIKALCLRDATSRNSWKYREEWWRAEQDSQAEVAFRALARTITSWDLATDEAALQLVLQIHPGGIQELTIRSGADSPTNPFFSSEDSPFPGILSQLSDLRHLSVQQANRGSAQGYDPIHPNTLIASYPFTNSLTSLDLTFGCQLMIGWTSNTLTFAELFPSLETLRLGDSYDIHPDVVPENLFSFPSLRFLHTRLDSAYIIPCFRLPAIQDLHLTIAGDEWTAMNFLEPDREDPLIILSDKLPQLLTLRNVYFEAEPGVSLTYQTIEFFRSNVEGDKIKVHTNFFVGKAEAKFPFARPVGRYARDDPGEDEDIEQFEAFDSHMTLVGLVEGAENVSKWITDRASRLEAGDDVVGAKSLMRSLFEVIELNLQDED